jgi:hypothetical protein
MAPALILLFLWLIRPPRAAALRRRPGRSLVTASQVVASD